MSNESQIWKRKPIPFVTTRDKPISVDTTSFTEDRRLVNWKRWLEDRKNLSYRIESITGRSQADQYWHNSPEAFRSLIEMKNLMEQATAPMVTDQYRGGPDFWQIPESLPDHGIRCRPKIPLTLTKRDLRLPTDLMHVGLSDLTMKERNLDRPKAKEEHWKRNKYLKTRKLELTKEIALLTPKEPEIAELSVQGHAFFREKKPKPRIPPISIEQCDKDDTEDVDQVTILKIQEREFVWKEAVRKTTEPTVAVDTDSLNIWPLIFTGEIGERIEREILLENKGTRVIVYHWRNWSVQPSNMSFEIRCSSFFFNKTKGLILPGQIVTIKVWCRSEKRGIFTESWRLITEPELSTSTFVFRFWSSVIDSRNIEVACYRKINEYLDLRVRDSMIRSIIEELMERLEQGRETTTTKSIYEISLLQDESFNSLNPNYFYCPSIMIQLQEIYHNVTDESASSWNLSLDILREIISQIGETDYRHDVLVRFNDLCKKCLRSDPDTVARTKYNVVYNVLCAFANLFENESKFAKSYSLLDEPVILIEIREKLIPSLRKKSSRSRQICSTKPIVKMQDLQARKKKEIDELRLQLYREIFFKRIYKALEKTIVRACTIIDSLQT